MIDVPLLRKMLELITSQREVWRQRQWATLAPDSPIMDQFQAMSLSDGPILAREEIAATAEESGCGTAFCLAGHVAAHDGCQVVWEYSRVSAPIAFDLIDPDGARMRIGQYAMERLGLDEPHANALFEAGNSLVMLWAIAEQITGGEIEMPPMEALCGVGTFGLADHVREGARNVIEHHVLRVAEAEEAGI